MLVGARCLHRALGDGTYRFLEVCIRHLPVVLLGDQR